MIITKKSLPRRTLLRGGLNTILALPLLDAMVPALAAADDATAKPVDRLTFVYVPNGIIMDKWTPAPVREGAAFEFTPILQPLAPFRDRLLMLSGLAHNEARSLVGEGTGDHSRASAGFLTCLHAAKTEGANLRLGVSIDQIAAQQLGKNTQLASLELGMDAADTAGACEAGYTCVYEDTLSWRTPTTPLPTENHPRAVFERLFGDSDSTDPKERLARIRRNGSILDSMLQNVASLLKRVGPTDRTKLTEYLDAIRDVERRVHLAEEQSSRTLPLLERPAGIPSTFEEHAKLMFDLQVLAYQCDLTRVTTFMMGHEGSFRTYAEIGIPDGHHPLTHHGGDASKIAKVIQINTFHIKMFGYFLDKLRSTPDGDGNLLDHSVILYGAGLSDGNMHTHVDLPVLVAGAGGGKIKGGRHLRYQPETPMSNLYRTILDTVGVPIETLATSTGKLDLG